MINRICCRVRYKDEGQGRTVGNASVFGFGNQVDNGSIYRTAECWDGGDKKGKGLWT